MVPCLERSIAGLDGVGLDVAFEVAAEEGGGVVQEIALEASRTTKIEWRRGARNPRVHRGNVGGHCGSEGREICWRRGFRGVLKSAMSGNR